MDSSSASFVCLAPCPLATGLGRLTRGFSLVEVTLALGIAAFCLVLLFGLLPTGLNVIQRGAEETLALNHVSALLADVRATPPTAKDANGRTVTARYGIVVIDPGKADANEEEFLLDEQGAKLALSDVSKARFRVFCRIPASGAGAQPKTRVYLRVSWPAGAANREEGMVKTSRAQGMVETSVTVNRYD